MTRNLSFQFEIKSLAETGEFDGYGSTFGNVDSQRDVVMPGAFKVTLRKHEESATWPAMLFQHDVRNPIGEWLELREDEAGLYSRGRLWIDGPHPDAWALKMYRAMRSQRGKVGLSIGFRTVHSKTDAKTGIRRLTEIELFEVSPVLFPANPQARVEHVKADMTTIRNFEAALRDGVSFSHAEARAIAAGGFKGWCELLARDELSSASGDDRGARDERGEVEHSKITEAVAALRRTLNRQPMRFSDGSHSGTG